MIVRSHSAMEVEAARFARGLAPRVNGATVVALSGPLGAGKTAFVKGVAKALGVEEHVTSPTFVIMKIYPIGKPAASNGAGALSFERLVHIDAYRLKGKHHLDVLGWEELIANPKNLILIEWPEQTDGALPPGAQRLTFRYSEGDAREIVYEGEAQKVSIA